MKFAFKRLQRLLSKSAGDPEIADLIQRKPDQIVRLAHEGYVEFKHEGVSVMFKEAARVVPQNEINDPKALHLDAFHFHSKDHDGYSEYQGRFPAGVAFGDSETEVIRKLGQPVAAGGDGFSSVLKKPIPRWLRYEIEHAIFQLQFDEDGNLEMVTLSLEEQYPSSISLTE